MSLARAALHVFADHRAVWLQDRAVQRQLDEARMGRAKAIIARGHAEGQAIWRLTPRESSQSALNPHMLESLNRLQLIRVAAYAEAYLIAGGLFEREAEERAIYTRKLLVQLALDRENEKARLFAERVQKRKARRSEL